MKIREASILILVVAMWGCGSETSSGIPDALDGEIAETSEAQDGDVPTDLPMEEGEGVDCGGADLLSDANNCGVCGFVCSMPHASPLCRGGICQIGTCDAGFFDVDRDPYNGCEYECSQEAGHELDDDGTCADGFDNDCDGRVDDEDPDCSDCVPEFCNEEDDDCDSLVDEDYDLRNDPVNCGDCGVFCPDRPNAEPLCLLGQCRIECSPGWADLNDYPVDGCEGRCTPTPDPLENTCDGVDNDCDGRVDEDYTTYTCGEGACEADSTCLDGLQVCVPYEPLSPLDALCDGIDNDCDGAVDEDFTPVFCVGACAAGARCDEGSEICGAKDETVDATCDNVDGDCDGEIDEDYVTYSCGTGVCENLSVCVEGVETCTPLPRWSPDDATCDDSDDDCDGNIDDDYVSYVCGVGVCVGTSYCDNGTEGCDAVDPGVTTDLLCDGLDEDCDGSIDEDYVPVGCGAGLCASTSSCAGGVETPCAVGNDDAYEAFGGGSCLNAVHVGVVTDDPPSLIDVAGTIYPFYDNDWYRVTANDDNDDGGDEFEFEVFWVTRPPGLLFDIYKGDCATSLCLRVDDCINWYTDFYVGGVGENPCTAANTAGSNMCNSDTDEFYIHVYRDSGSEECAEYALRIRNNPTSPGTGCIHP